MQQPSRDQSPASSFFIRLWHEGHGTTRQWRGEVRHIQSGDTAYFARASHLLTFLQTHGGIALLDPRKKREVRRRRL